MVLAVSRPAGDSKEERQPLTHQAERQQIPPKPSPHTQNTNESHIPDHGVFTHESVCNTR